MNRRSPAGAHRRRPTQADVARLAGVSVPLVSAVISGSPGSKSIGASTQTRERVWEAVRTLGYVPNVAARSLAGGSNKLISVFTYEPVFPAESENPYHEFFVGIEQEADAQGYSLLLVTSSRGPDGERAVYVEGSNSLQLADGAIIFGGHHDTAEMARLAQDQFPFVHIGRRDVRDAEISYIAADNIAGTIAATRALVDHGHRRIGFAATGLSTEAASDRRSGFDRAVDELGLTPSESPVLPARSGDLLEQILDHHLTAIILESPHEALAVRREATRGGIDVPGDLSMISLTGFGNEHHPSSLTRLLMPRREMGRCAVRALIHLLDDPSMGPIRETIPCELKLGRTVAAPKIDTAPKKSKPGRADQSQ